MTETLQARWPGIDRTPSTPFKARVAKAILKPTVQQVPVRLTFADGTVWGAGGPGSPEMVVRRPAAFFNRLGADTKIGFGEAYMAGDWVEGADTDLADLLRPFAERLTTIVPPSLQKLRRLVDQALPHQRRRARRVDAEDERRGELHRPQPLGARRVVGGDQQGERAEAQGLARVQPGEHMTGVVEDERGVIVGDDERVRDLRE